MYAVVFHGQGSQYPNMIEHIQQIAKKDRALDEMSSAINYDILGVLSRADDSQLKSTLDTQLAIFAFSALLWRAFKDGLAERNSVAPALFAGHSIGELNALHASEAFSHTTGAAITYARGSAMSRAIGGGMYAVVKQKLHSCLDIVLKNNCYIACINSPNQFVVCGTNSNIRAFVDEMPQMLCKRLRVSHPFHSMLMRKAEAEFRDSLNIFKDDIGFPQIPVISNAFYAPYNSTSISHFMDDISFQISRTVHWLKIMECIVSDNIKKVVSIGPRSPLLPMFNDFNSIQDASNKIQVFVLNEDSKIEDAIAFCRS